MTRARGKWRHSPIYDSVLEGTQRRKVAMVLIPGALRAGARIAYRVVDQVQNRPPPRGNVVGRTMHHVAVNEGDRTGGSYQRFDPILFGKACHRGVVDMMQFVPLSLSFVVELGFEKAVAL